MRGKGDTDERSRDCMRLIDVAVAVATTAVQ